VPKRVAAKGLRQFLSPEQQRAWLEGYTNLPDADERSESLEQRFKYAARFEKLLQRPQAQEVLDILRLYADNCIPIPRATERLYWSVSCLPSTSDKPLARVNASWMELFTLSARAQREDCEAIVEQRVESAKRGRPAGFSPTGSTSRNERQPCDSMARAKASDGALAARFILHLSDFTADHPSPLGEGADAGLEPGEAGEDDPSSPSYLASPSGPLPLPWERALLPDHLDQALLQTCVDDPATIGHFFWKGDTLGVKVRGSASIRAFLAHPRGLRAIRRFNLTHMNRGRNAYQASHCYSLADCMVEAPSAGEQLRSDCEASSKAKGAAMPGRMASTGAREPASGSPSGEPD
jgi:hypothetical protein